MHTVDLPDGASILLVVHEGIYNGTTKLSLPSEFRLRDFEEKIDSTCHRHGGTQQMAIQDDAKSFPLPLEIADCIVYFKHRKPTPTEVG